MIDIFSEIANVLENMVFLYICKFSFIYNVAEVVKKLHETFGFAHAVNRE